MYALPLVCLYFFSLLLFLLGHPEPEGRTYAAMCTRPGLATPILWIEVAEVMCRCTLYSRQLLVNELC